MNARDLLIRSIDRMCEEHREHGEGCNVYPPSLAARRLIESATEDQQAGLAMLVADVLERAELRAALSKLISALVTQSIADTAPASADKSDPFDMPPIHQKDPNQPV